MGIATFTHIFFFKQKIKQIERYKTKFIKKILKLNHVKRLKLPILHLRLTRSDNLI